MTTLVKLVSAKIKYYFGGFFSSIMGSVVDRMPTFIDTSFLTQTTDVLGIAVPSFIIYLFFAGE